MKVKGKNALGYSRIVPTEVVGSDLEISRSLVNDLGLLPMDQLANSYVYTCLLLMIIWKYEIYWHCFVFDRLSL